MVAARFLQETFAPVVDLVYPPRCPACGDAIAAQNGLCAQCWAELDIPGEPACEVCQRPLHETSLSVGGRCQPCRNNPPRHSGIAAGTIYNETSRQLILAFKHGGRIALAGMLARLVATRLPEPDAARVLVPVPLHRWRLWGRGYNQSALLAGELSKAGHGQLLVDGLRRTKHTPALGGMSGKERAEILRGAIAVNERRKRAIEDAEVILVDDVLTSGATTDACTQALLSIGARSVRIACAARVPDVRM